MAPLDGNFKTNTVGGKTQHLLKITVEMTHVQLGWKSRGQDLGGMWKIQLLTIQSYHSLMLKWFSNSFNLGPTSFGVPQYLWDYEKWAVNHHNHFEAVNWNQFGNMESVTGKKLWSSFHYDSCHHLWTDSVEELGVTQRALVRSSVLHGQ